MVIFLSKPGSLLLAGLGGGIQRENPGRKGGAQLGCQSASQTLTPFPSLLESSHSPSEEGRPTGKGNSELLRDSRGL